MLMAQEEKNTTIPKGWRVTTLGEIAEIIGGGTPRTGVDEYWNGEIPWLSEVLKSVKVDATIAKQSMPIFMYKKFHYLSTYYKNIFC
jgi:restriction endonuclease S subunit